MKYKIDEHKNGIDISVTEAKNEQQKLPEAFSECQSRDNDIRGQQS